MSGVSEELIRGLKVDTRYNPERPLRVAVVGNGNIYRLAYKPALKILSSDENFFGKPVVEILGTCDLLVERAESAAMDLKAPRYFSSHRELLDQLADDLDAVIVATPTYTHYEIAKDAIERGVNVILEKPISHDLNLAYDLIELAKRKGVKLLIGHTRRFDPRWRLIREEIRAGKLGEILFIKRSERARLPFPPDSWHWFPDRGGGVHLDVGIHSVDLVNWLLGEEPVETYLTYKQVREESKRGGAPDWASFKMIYGSGAVAEVEVSWVHPPASAKAYSYLYIAGTKGVIHLDDLEDAPAYLITDQGIDIPRYSTLASAPLEAFVFELSHFVNVILGDIQPDITPEESLKALEIILSAYEPF